MLEIPVRIVDCSWPRPVTQAHGRWTSEPEWDAPLMPSRPEPRCEILDGALVWAVDWREFFRAGVRLWNPHMSGEMRGFHVVFRVEVRESGVLDFWDDDGCVIRRDGRVVHDDRSAHPATRHELEARAGDVLEIAQWQFGWGWLWGGRVRRPGVPPTEPLDVLLRYREAVRARLERPEGPPLKLYTNGATPLRAVLAVYSLILNGYAPAGVDLLGEDQWSERSRAVFAAALPFARVVPTGAVLDRVRAVGGPGLADWARQHWFVMKTLVALLIEPRECCLIDDDVIVLDRFDDALERFGDHDLVFSPDQDMGDAYRATWRGIPGLPPVLPTARFNAGLYWVRPAADPRVVAGLAQRARPVAHLPVQWEQGLVACLYANKRASGLSPQRYFFPVVDGLPGGPLGYDYASNPCGFAMIHFAGLVEKPSDAAAVQLAGPVLDRAIETTLPSGDRRRVMALA